MNTSAANLGIRCEWVQSLCVTLLLGEPPGELPCICRYRVGIKEWTGELAGRQIL